MKTLEPTYGITFREAAVIIPVLCKLADRGLTEMIKAARSAIIGATTSHDETSLDKVMGLITKAALERLPVGRMPWDLDKRNQPDTEIMKFLGNSVVTPKEPDDAVEGITRALMHSLEDAAQFCLDGIGVAAQAMLNKDALPLFKFLYDAEMVRGRNEEWADLHKKIDEFAKGFQKPYNQRKAAYFACPHCGSEDTHRSGDYDDERSCAKCEKTFRKSEKIDLRDEEKE